MQSATKLAAALALFATPVLADGHASGDAAAGESVFGKCQSCHVVANDAGDILAGARAKTGPNLYGLSGRVAGSVDGFRYKKSIVAAGEAGLAWDEEKFVAYLADPRKYLRTYLDDKRASSGMSFKLANEEDAKNVWAFITSLE
jgi:cytochrome c